MIIIRFAQLTEQVCTSHILVRLHFLLIIHKNFIFSMSFELLPLHVVYCKFLNLHVIIMYSVNFTVSIFC